MKHNKVDILLPYWGEFSLLKETVESILSQTHKEWRLYVYDDCYPSDEARKYFASLDDSRIVYFRHEKNIGISKNFNFAISATDSDFCVIPGCDDVFLPQYLEVALANIKDADFYQPGVEVIDENSKSYLPLGDRIKRMLQPRSSGQYSGEKLATSLCHGNWLYFPSILWKTETIKRYGFNTKYKIVEDVELELNIIKQGGVLSFDKRVTFQYRRFAHSLSSTSKSDGYRFNEEDAVYDDFTQQFISIGWNKAARAAKIHITSRLHKLLATIKA